jgi:co-chaperonin GroES (HSP10)
MTKTLYVPEDVLKKIKNPAEGVEADRKELEKLPKPVGWRILVLPFKAKDKTKGGILLTDKTIDTGPDAYADKEKFPNGPWCKQGDWVVFGRYAGSRLKIEGGEVRLLNDDEILGTVDSPEDILSIM